MIPTYSREDYLLFFLAIALFWGSLALLGAILEWQEKRRAKQQEYKLHSLNRREDWRRQHNTYLAQMQAVLTRVERRPSA